MAEQRVVCVSVFPLSCNSANNQTKHERWVSINSLLFQELQFNSFAHQTTKAMYMGHVEKAKLRVENRAIWDHYRENGYITGLSDNEVRNLYEGPNRCN